MLFQRFIFPRDISTCTYKKEEKEKERKGKEESIKIKSSITRLIRIKLQSRNHRILVSQQRLFLVFAIADISVFEDS